MRISHKSLGLKEIKLELKRRVHEPVPETGQWLQAVVRGHFRYYGVPTNKPGGAHCLNAAKTAG